MNINIEELNKIKEEIFNTYVDNKDKIIEDINNDVNKLLDEIINNKEEEEQIDE